MIAVYLTDNLMDAHLIKGVLENNGIRSHVAGEHLLGGIGELPASGLLRVLVTPDQAPAAQALIFEVRGSGESVVDASRDLDPGALPAPA